jgi:hypothetical protein
MSAPWQPGPRGAADGAATGASTTASAAASTGHPAVDAVVAALGGVASLSPREQVAAYADAHRTLQQTLGSIEER